MSIRINALLLAIITVHTGSITASNEQTTTSTPPATEAPAINYENSSHPQTMYRACGQLLAAYVKAVVIKPYPAVNTTRIGMPDLNAFHRMIQHNQCDDIRRNDGQEGQCKLVKNAEAYALEQEKLETENPNNYSRTFPFVGEDWKRTAQELRALLQEINHSKQT